jgi:hypothetical protein
VAQRRPKGYLGKNHETIGSDILSVLQVLKLPEHMIGKEETQRLAGVDPDGWYPISWLLELMEVLDQKVGYYGLMQMGRALFKLSHEERVLARATCARDTSAPARRPQHGPEPTPWTGSQPR